MSFVTQLSIGWFPFAILLIIYADNRSHRSPSATLSDKFFNWLILAIAAVILCSIASTLPTESTAAYARAASWILNIIYRPAICIVLYVWMLYTAMRLDPHHKILAKPLYTILLALPAAVTVIMSLAAPITRRLFYIDRANYYQRGSLYFIPHLVDIFYLIALLIISIVEYRRATTIEKRKDALILAIFAPMPIIGIVLQIINLDLWLMLPFLSISVLIVYILVQNHRITIDPLTGLCNNTEFERYVKIYLHRGAPYCLIIADILDFQQFCDNNGHQIGDEVLRRVADIFHDTFNDPNTVLSRIGNNEFAMITPCENDANVNHIIEQLHDAVAVASARGTLPEGLSLSIGYELFDRRYTGNIHQLIASAHERIFYTRRTEAADSTVNETYAPADSGDAL